MVMLLDFFGVADLQKPGNVEYSPASVSPHARMVCGRDAEISSSVSSRRVRSTSTPILRASMNNTSPAGHRSLVLLRKPLLRLFAKIHRQTGICVE